VDKLIKEKSSENTEKEEVAMQSASLDIWEKKYRLLNKTGEPVDKNIDATYQRVARALAEVEDEKNQDYWYQKFIWALHQGAIPAGRIISNAGAKAYKSATSTINCTVAGTVEDSIDTIFEKLHEAGLTLKTGAGIGYEFSTLRPKDAYVSGAGARTSGPLSFMDIFDKMCFTISSAGGRRGAQMATFDVGHPDVFEFIQAKREDGRLRQFNLSLLITDDFMQAVEKGDDWPLAFPISEAELQIENISLDDADKYSDKILWRNWPVSKGYVVNDIGKVACKIYRKVPAQQLWDAIMSATYDYAEPGFILIDQYNQMNNNWFCENIRATNPCGEQGLPPYGACLLGSINLVRFVDNPFTDTAEFNWSRFREVVNVFTRMLDNVVELNGLPLPEQREEIIRKRRHGLGFLGLGSALTLLGLTYGSKASVAFTEKVSREIALEGWRAGLELAKEKCPAPIMEEDFIVTEGMLAIRPEMTADGYSVGDTVKGKVLHSRYSRYMQKIASVEPELVKALSEVGARFTHHSSLAPTGTIALSLGNNVSNGIEPSFAHHYTRNIIREGKKSKEPVDVFSYELLAYKTNINASAMPDAEQENQQLPNYFVSADSVLPEQHVDVQAAAQQWVDSSISKTINVPTDIPYEKFKNIYSYAYSKGLKGCTTFRFNPEAFQGVLVKDKDLANTLYQFTLDDGAIVEVRGNEEIEYDGEKHTAANLYDALKEGYYGKL
jgi:ribonucleoside-diphosphate reductase alpha chain